MNRFRSERLEKAGTVDFKKHPARKVGTLSRQCRPKVPGRFAFPSARNPRIFRSRPGKPNQRKGQNEKFMNFAHFCEFWCFSSGKQARFTLNFYSGMPLRKVHELTFLWFGLPGPLLKFVAFRESRENFASNFPGTFPKFSSGTPEQTLETATAFPSFLIRECQSLVSCRVPSCEGAYSFRVVKTVVLGNGGVVPCQKTEDFDEPKNDENGGCHSGKTMVYRKRGFHNPDSWSVPPTERKHGPQSRLFVRALF